MYRDANDTIPRTTIINIDSNKAKLKTDIVFRIIHKD